MRVARPTRDLERATAFYRLLVLYLGSPDAVGRVKERLRSAGLEPRTPANPYWAANGTVCFVDPDGTG